MSKKRLRRDRAMQEITKQKAKRRSGIMQCALGGILAVLVIMGIPVLQNAGILPYGDMIISVVTFASAILACGVLGLGVQKYSRANRQINYLKQQFGITNEEIHEL